MPAHAGETRHSRKLMVSAMPSLNWRLKIHRTNAAADFNFEFFQNSCIYCRFSLRCETTFTAAKKLETFFIAVN